VADGPLFSSTGASAKLAMGLDVRQELLRQHEIVVGFPDHDGAYRREIGSVFGEVALRMPAHLELSLAARYEHYSDFGSTTNPKLGIRWSPLESIKLRASCGTSFRAPELPDADTSRNDSGLQVFPDPKSPTGRSYALFEEGNYPNLHQERAVTWTGGLDLAPPGIPGLQSSLTYYSIDYRDRIAVPSLPDDPINILMNEALWGGVIQRNPAQATVQSICNGPTFIGNPMDCQSTPPTVLIDFRQRNLYRTLDKGVDLNLEQRFDNSLGLFRLSAQGAYILTFDQAVTNSAPLTSVANTLSYPLKVRARSTLSWSERKPTLPGLSFALSTNFTGAYLDNVSIPNRRIASYSTVDAQLGYSTGETDRWFENTEITLSATNLFDANPPFVNTEFGYDRANTPPMARLVTVSLRKKW
jgi:outer membrane receptor protein involved in Fe transport